MRRKVNHSLYFLTSVSETSSQELLSIVARQPSWKMKDFIPLMGGVPVTAEMKTPVWESSTSTVSTYSK